MKTVSFILLLICPLFSNSQNYSRNFKVKDFIVFFDNDSVKFFFDDIGRLVQKDRANYYRKGKIDKTHINVYGQFRDYHINGRIALEATMMDDMLNGKATYYYNKRKRRVEAEGYYSKDKKVGNWYFYYKNGRLSEVINFSDSIPVIEKSYNKKGKQEVCDRSGFFKGYFRNFSSDDQYIAKGEVQNGKMTEWWSMYTSSNEKIADELFEDNKFVRGISMGYEYKDFPRLKISKYYPSETITFYDNLLGWDKSYRNLFTIRWNNKFPLYYFNQIEAFLNSSIPHDIKDQWIFVSFKMKEETCYNELHIRSSIGDSVVEELAFQILNTLLPEFHVHYVPTNLKANYFFGIMIQNGVTIIPSKIVQIEIEALSRIRMKEQ